MIIAVSGLSGSGKNTFGKALAEKLGYRMVCPTFKELAEKEGVSLLEFQEKAVKDPEIDKKFDEELKERAKGDCVVTTWLGPWMVDADFRILVFAPEKVRAERLAKRDGKTLEEALEHIRKRDSNNRERYKKLYGIDIYDTSSFDLALSAATYRPEQMVEIALKAIEEKKR
jgi:cytidylate kinase